MWKQEEPVQSAAPQVTSTTNSVPRKENSANQNVIIGKSIVLKGELHGSEDLTIEGQVEGKITLKQHALRIGAHGRIRAQVFAKSVVVLGEVVGNIEAAEKSRSATQGRSTATSRLHASPSPKEPSSAAASTCSRDSRPTVPEANRSRGPSSASRRGPQRPRVRNLAVAQRPGGQGGSDRAAFPLGGGRRVCHGAPATSAPVDHASRTGWGRTVRLPQAPGALGERRRTARWADPRRAQASSLPGAAIVAASGARRAQRSRG